MLILHQHFKTPESGGAIRSYYLAKALVAKGIDTVVITAHNGPGKEERDVEGIKVHYLPVAYDNRFGFYKRIISFFRFMMGAAKAAAGHGDAHVCYAISTPLTTGWAARIIRRKYGIPYVFEVGDLWPDAPVEMGIVKGGMLKSLLYRMEKEIYRKAESVVALSHPIRNAILKKTSEKTVHVVPNMADLEFFTPGEKRNVLEEQFSVMGKFVVSYIGALGVANGLRYFLDCAAECQRAGLDVHFVLCGDGAMVEDLTAYAKKMELANLTWVPFQNRAGVKEVMNITDANFICYQPVKILETGSPNKYFDGLAAGKLTIVNFGGWVKEEIQREACGVCVDANDAREFVNKLRPFLQDRALLKEYQLAARRLAEKKYSRKELGILFADIVVSAVRTVTARAQADKPGAAGDR